MVQKDIRNLRQALKFFECAYNGLSKAWDNVVESNEVNNAVSEIYPFEYSFDEYEVKEWVKNAREKLKDIRVE
jgi:hypothetical protein